MGWAWNFWMKAWQHFVYHSMVVMIKLSKVTCISVIQRKNSRSWCIERFIINWNRYRHSCDEDHINYQKWKQTEVALMYLLRLAKQHFSVITEILTLTINVCFAGGDRPLKPVRRKSYRCETVSLENKRFSTFRS